MNTESVVRALPHERLWAWFVEKAKSKHALLWLGAICFSEPIFLPLMPELFVAALLVAHPKRWKEFLLVSIVSATLGAITAFFLAMFLFHQVGETVLNLYGLRSSFALAQHLLHRHVFVTMFFASYTLIPDKVFIYAAGFLGVHFLPAMVGFFVGRALRLTASYYLIGKYGPQVIPLLKRYVFWIGLVLLTVLLWYGIVHVGGAHGGAAPL